MINNLKLKLVAPLAIIGLSASAQMSNVQSAANSLRFKELADAKKYIDLAATNEKTSNDPKMWFYRASVYDAINKEKDQKLDADALVKAVESFMNCEKTDIRKNHEDDLKKMAWAAIDGVEVYNKAVDATNKGEYDKAFKLYDLMFQILPYDKDKNLVQSGVTAEALYRNTYLTAIKAKDNVKAKQNIQKVMDINPKDSISYSDMERLLLEEKDTAKALTFIEKGLSLFPKDNILITAEMNIYIAKKDMDGLLVKLTKSIEMNPKNPVSYDQRATVYGQKGEYDKAIADYKKEIELNPTNAEAYYDLGAAVYNQGYEIINKANGIKNDAEYQKAKKRGDDKMAEALPYLEKSHELNPKSKNTLNVLKQIYVRNSNTEKYNQIKAELDALK